ncbi:MAG: enoyl-CoA hydratase/isomerase family protein [Haloarculaceae archaeon]
MTDAELTYEVDGRVGVVSYARPPVNALRYEDIAALDEFLAALPEGDELAVVFETGGDRAFSAGHDVAEFGADGVPTGEAATEIYMSALETIYEFPLPLIAAVDGPAVGAGAILASLCDDRVVGPDASFAITEINVGIVGGLGPLKRVLPDGVARRMAYTGERLPAERARELGLASELADDPGAAARDLAATIAENSPDAVRAAKASAVEGQPAWPLAEYRREREYIDDLREGDDAGEAADAFLEGREPDYEG